MVLVCENMHILTYMILLFVVGLPRPFYYPHPCVSAIFSFELLDSPFVVTAGVHQSSEWLKGNINEFSERISFIDLNKPEGISEKRKSPKSPHLRKLFSSFYKQLDCSMFKRKEKIIKLTSREENESCYSFVRASGILSKGRSSATYRSGS